MTRVPVSVDDRSPERNLKVNLRKCGVWIRGGPNYCSSWKVRGLDHCRHHLTASERLSHLADKRKRSK